MAYEDNLTTDELRKIGAIGEEIAATWVAMLWEQPLETMSPSDYADAIDEMRYQEEQQDYADALDAGMLPV